MRGNATVPQLAAARQARESLKKRLDQDLTRLAAQLDELLTRITRIESVLEGEAQRARGAPLFMARRGDGISGDGRRSR
jgi:hypothetical protein